MAGHVLASRKDDDVISSCVLVLVTFLSHFLSCGVSYCYGVYYVTFLEVYGQSAGVTSWIGSLNTGLLCAVGPIASYMIEKISVRNTVITGGVTSSIGLLIGAFSPSLLMLFLSLGIITGIGYGFVYASGIVVIGISLTRHRTLAMGISISGVGLGNFAYPFLANYLMDVYGWRGALLITSGLTLNICVFALFMVGKIKDNAKELDENVAKDTEAPGATEDKMEYLNLRQNHIGHATEGSCASLVSSGRSLRSNRSLKHLNLGIRKIRPFLTDVERARSTELLYSVIGRSTSRTNIMSRTGFTSLQSLNNSRNRLPVKSETDGVICSNQTPPATKLNGNERSATVTPPTVVNSDNTAAVESNLNNSQFHQTETPENKPNLNSSRLYAFTFPSYWLVQANAVLFCLGFSSVLTHAAAYSQYVGLSVKTGGILLSLSGAMSVAGRISLGAVTQLPTVNTFLLYGFCCLIAGIAVLIMTMWTSFAGLLTCMATFGTFSSAYGPVLAEVTMEVVGLEHFNYGYGFLMISMALGTTLGAPMAGWLYDLTLQYTSSFYFGGSCLLLSAILMLPLAIVGARTPRDHETSDETTSMDIDV